MYLVLESKPNKLKTMINSSVRNCCPFLPLQVRGNLEKEFVIKSLRAVSL